MEHLRNILLAHAACYPQMQPTDAVKLLYQNEFGGGHLVRDEAQCLAYLRAEYANTPQSAVHLTEDIGNGMVRVYLGALDAHGYSVESLGSDFIRSARVQTGMLPSFQKKMELLRQLTAEDRMPFSMEALEAYLEEYEEAGYPMVSHSAEYRCAYRPAYRVLRKVFLSTGEK